MLLAIFFLWCLAYVLRLMTVRDLAICYLLMVATMVLALVLLWAGVTHAGQLEPEDEWRGVTCWNDDCPA